MRGHIRRLGKDSYKLWIEHPRVNGERRREVVTVRGTLKDAEATLAERIAAVERGDFSRAGKMTTAQALALWLRRCERSQKVGHKALERYRAIVRDYLEPTLGSVPLKKLQGEHVEAALATWSSSQRKSRRGTGIISQRTVHHIFTTLRSALNYAVKKDLIARNPCNSVEDIPSKGRPEITALNEQQASNLLSALSGTKLYAPVLLALSTGMRRGELLALKWEDVDLQKGCAVIRKSLEQLGARDCGFKEPKTPKSRRVVYFHADAIEALKRHKAEQNSVRLAIGGAYNELGLVFPEPITGEPWRPDKLSCAFRYAVHKAGINITFHGLRHSFASIAGRSGVSLKDTSEVLGHSTIAITADMYSHVFDDSRREAADRVGDALSAAQKRGA